MEEVFFFEYYLHESRNNTLAIPINERKWLIARFFEQKERENEAMEKAKRKAKIK
jgi:hypothetical protein